MVDNPSAFPTQYTLGPNAGMTLRDWFAGQAIPTLAQLVADGRIVTELDGMTYAKLVANQAYTIADALLEERNK